MKLVVDVGNSRMKWARVGASGLESGTAVARREPLENTLDAHWPGPEKPAAVLISSVAGARFNARLERWVLARWGCRPAWFRSQAKTLGITNGYNDYARLGSDRWAALLGARGLGPGPVGVLDCGTAVTLDIVDGEDRHLGGFIFPGLELVRRSLWTGTANIPEAAAGPEGRLGLSTAECVSNGTAVGLAGALERWMADVERLVDGVAWLATGGSWPQVRPLVRRTIDYDPDLVLRGLARVLE